MKKLVDDLENIGAEFSPRWRAARLISIEQEVREAVVEEAIRRLRETLQRQEAGSRTVSELLSGTMSVEEAATKLLDDTVRRTPLQS